MAAARGRAGVGSELDEALVRAGRYLRRGVVSADLRTLQKSGGRGADSFYRGRWSYDKVVRSAHSVNRTGSCSWKVYVTVGSSPGGSADRLPVRRSGSARLRAARGVPARRGVLLVHLLADPDPLSLRARRATGAVPEARARRSGDPVEVWTEITGNPGLARRYQSARGKGGFVRASWDEAVVLAAAAHVHTIRTWVRTGSPGSARSRR
jgi:nitrate reductase alpha subunit